MDFTTFFSPWKLKSLRKFLNILVFVLIFITFVQNRGNGKKYLNLPIN